MREPVRHVARDPGAPWVHVGTGLALLGLLAALVGFVPLFVDAAPLPAAIWAVAATGPLGAVLIAAGTRRTAPMIVKDHPRTCGDDLS